MKSKVLMVLAGAAVSSVALAGSPDTDRAYAAELSADAAARSSQLAAGSEAFKLTAGENTMYISGSTMFRWTSDFRSKNQVGKYQEYTHGFSIPLTRFRFWGNTVSKELSYGVQLAAKSGSSTSDNSFNLEDAYFKYQWDNGFYVKGGQYKLPFLREELVSEERQLTVARSITNNAFTLGRSQGLELGYAAQQWRLMVDFSDGANAANTEFNSSAEADWALTARVEFMAMGNDWNRWQDLTSWKDADSNALLIGLAGHYQSSGRTGDSTTNTGSAKKDLGNKAFGYTADISFEGMGWNVFGAFVGRHYDSNASGVPKIDDFGWVVQGGVFVTDQVELFARYNGLRADKDNAGSGNRSFHWLTAGANYYVSPRSHAFKITGDVVWALSKTTGQEGFQTNSFTNFVPDANAGTLGQGKKNEVAVQLQATVMW
jgi:phosphate-selective porin OprO/OprP